MNTTERYHGLDALRALAMMLGIALHGGMAYIGKYMSPAEKGGWPYDSASSMIILLVIIWIHAWRMQVFFLMAGFFANLVVQRRGLRSFLKNRFRRVFIPFVLGLLILLPLTIAVLVYGAWRTGTLNQDTNSDSTGFPLIHLWFLYYLMGFYLVTAAACWLANRYKSLAARFLKIADRAVHAAMESRWRLLWLALPTMLLRALIGTEEVTLFGPNLPFFLYQGLFFAFGWLVFRQPDLLKRLSRRRVWLGYLLTGTLVLLPLTLIVGDSLSERHILYAGLHSLKAWSLTMGFIGMCDALNAKARGWVLYLTDAAYWVYLAHMPVVIVLNTWLIGLPWSALPKYTVVCAVSTVFLLATYHWCVRYTAIGNLLNGPRQRSLAQ